MKKIIFLRFILKSIKSAYILLLQTSMNVDESKNKEIKVSPRKSSEIKVMNDWYCIIFRNFRKCFI